MIVVALQSHLIRAKTGPASWALQHFLFSSLDALWLTPHLR